MSLSFRVDDAEVEFDAEVVVIAGFTGRNRQAVLDHITELRELGVPTPEIVPSHYAAPPTAATQTDAVTLVRPDTSGEAEAVLVVGSDRMWLTLGSDHTDRAAESLDIAISKLVCPKPVARDAWTFDSVADHLDALELQSWITEGGHEVAYQSGTLAEIAPLADLVQGTPFTTRPDRFLLFTGTFPAIGGIRPASRFRATLTDPVTDRKIELDYRIDVVDIIDDASTDTAGGHE